MSVAVEIGAGHTARPDFFTRRYDEYYVVDNDPERLAWGRYEGTYLRPVLADAANLDFADCSVDVVLARNVFGHAVLGFNPDQESHWHELRYATKRGQASRRERKELTEINNGIFEKKVAIMHEAARILVEGGKLVSVDYYTPQYATDFFTALETLPIHERPCLTVEEVALSSVAKPHYAEHDTRSKTWVAVK